MIKSSCFTPPPPPHIIGNDRMMPQFYGHQRSYLTGLDWLQKKFGIFNVLIKNYFLCMVQDVKYILFLIKVQCIVLRSVLYIKQNSSISKSIDSIGNLLRQYLIFSIKDVQQCKEKKSKYKGPSKGLQSFNFACNLLSQSFFIYIYIHIQFIN